jgi:hypothetical protein
MLPRDPDTDRVIREPYSSGAPNVDLRAARARQDRWSAGSMIGALVAMALIVAALIYGISRSFMPLPSGPSTASTSGPSTTGAGAGSVPSGPAR